MSLQSATPEPDDLVSEAPHNSRAMAVDLVTNAFERNLEQSLRPEFWEQTVASNEFDFRRRVLLVNNVDDARAVARRADELLAQNCITEWHWVAELLPTALEIVGLEERDLGRLPHYSDCALCAIALPGSDWLLYWDADVSLKTAENWIGPAIELFARNPAVLVANPRWSDQVPAREVEGTDQDFALGYGFSDQVFLARRRDLARPIYRHRCLASLRYPMSHISPIFEARVDAYMRTHQKLRATHLSSQYEHPPLATNAPHREPQTRAERWRRRRNRWVRKLLARSPFRDPRWRI